MKKVLVLLIIIFFGWLVVRFVIGGSEDDWICQNGHWVQHGQPSSLMPTGNCR